jgi:hypothetical protein
MFMNIIMWHPNTLKENFQISNLIAREQQRGEIFEWERENKDLNLNSIIVS